MNRTMVPDHGQYALCRPALLAPQGLPLRTGIRVGILTVRPELAAFDSVGQAAVRLTFEAIGQEAMRCWGRPPPRVPR